MMRRLLRFSAAPLAVALITQTAAAPRLVAKTDSQPVQAVKQLNDTMFGIYDDGLAAYKAHVRARVPLIMGLFNGEGGQLILYAPGQEPEVAPPVPLVYTMAKSVSHTAMAMYALLTPVMDQQDTPTGATATWLDRLAAYRAQAATARAAIPQLPIKAEEAALLLRMLDRIIPFMDQVLQARRVSKAELQAFARGVEPCIECCVRLAAETQVQHWYKVLDEWKRRLGKQWAMTYGMTNSIYVTRQNNILFSILVQFMGEKAINDRLLLIETTSFTTTPDDMLDLFCRITSDRCLGKMFFNNDKLMDYELLGWEARKAIQRAAASRKEQAVLPPLVPLNSHAWPWRTDPASGTGPTSFDDLHASGALPTADCN